MDWFLHTANVLYVLSYSVRDILWLRLLSVVAMLTLLPFYAAADLWQAIYWNVLFLAINLVQLYRLLLERRPVQLSVDEQRLHRLGFQRLRPRDFLRLSRVGRWCATSSEVTLLERDAPVQTLRVLVEGEARVELDGQTPIVLSSGQFIGEIGFVTGRPAAARVVALPGARWFEWSGPQLRAHLETRPDVRSVVQDVIGTDLAAKLRCLPKAATPGLAPMQPTPA